MGIKMLVSQAIMPLLTYMTIQLGVTVIGLNFVRDRRINPAGIIKTWILGQVFLLGIFELIAVPMILLKWNFDVLFWSFFIICIFLFVMGCFKLKGREWNYRPERSEFTCLAVILLVLTAGLIAFQAGNYFFKMHLDEDDARWLAEANDALTYGNMMTRNVHTGELLPSGFTWVKDVVSPWPLVSAMMSKLLNLSPAAFLHTIYAPIAVLEMYGVYWLVGRELFDQFEARCSFLLFGTVLHLFCAETGYEQTSFALIRIWQGKASIAGIIIPLLLYLFICIHKRNQIDDWVNVTFTACASCLMSGMGVVLSAVMIGVYGLYDVLMYRRWKRIPLLIIALLPSIACWLISMVLKR